MSTEQAISVKNLCALFENASVQIPQRVNVEDDLASKQPIGNIGKAQGVINPTLSDDPSLESNSCVDKCAEYSSKLKPSSIISEFSDNMDVFENHPISELDRDIDSTDSAPSSAKLISPITEARASNDHGPTSESSSPMLFSGHSNSVERAEMSPLADSPQVSNSPADSTVSKSTTQMRPPRPVRPQTYTKPPIVDRVASQISIKPDQITNTPNLPKRTAVTVSETPVSKTVKPETSSLVDPRNESSNTRRSAPLPPVRCPKDLVPSTQERILQFGRHTATGSTAYDSLFQKLCIQESPCPVVRAGAVKMVWNRSGLPAQDLSYIWRTVTDSDPTCTCLTMEQFIAGTRMVDEKRQRIPATHFS